MQFPANFKAMVEDCRVARGTWHAVAHLVEALRYNSVGRGIDSRWCH